MSGSGWNILVLVFQGKELLLSQCIVASIPANERSSQVVWELWRDTHLGEDCPLAAATPRFAWLESNGTLRVPGTNQSMMIVSI